MGLDTVELVLSVEQIFDIELPDAMAEKLDTVGKLHQYIVSEHHRLNRPNINSDIIFDQLRTIVCYQLGVEPEEVKPDARFIQDLGAD
jgi:acyl carrier protein